ncbi:uncharacterized protein BYT42DRAFT_484387, partial [Radiomyces spectabilis]|uniref:uncharacterized protein n=1 Tax=Radiomyces spectabilis TaxID=64574 RepID=UPI002220244A
SPQQVAILIKALSLLGSIRYTTNQDVTHCAQEPEVRRYKHERNSKQIKESLSVQAQVALKRQRNTDAARRSRLRKVMKMDALERRVRDLEVDNSQLRLRVASISEDIKDTITEEQRKRQRIQELEAQLAQVHQALL